MAAPPACTERVLYSLPHPEPADLVPRLERGFPGIEITYIKTGTTNYGKWGEGELDKSKMGAVRKQHQSPRRAGIQKNKHNYKKRSER